MAITFNDQEQLQLGRSSIGVRDTYVRPAVDPNAGGGMRDLAKALEGMSGAFSAMEETRAAKDAEDSKAWAITTFAELGGKATPDDLNNVLSPFNGISRKNRADNLGLVAGKTFAANWNTNFKPEDLANPEATEAFWNKGILELKKQYPGADPAFLASAIESFYAESRGYVGKADNVRTEQHYGASRDAMIESIKSGSETFTPARAPNPAQASAVMAAAKRLNVDPRYLTAFLLFETGGKMTPDAPTMVPGSNRYGLIQVKPGGEEERMFGFSPTQTFDEQVLAVERYLKARGFKGTGTQADFYELYSTINAGSPGKLDFRDGGGRSVKENADLAKARWGKKAEEFLGLMDVAPLNGGDGKRGSLIFTKPQQEAGVQADVKAKAEMAAGIFGKPLKINSGHRDEAYNASVGGAKNSQHVEGNALDIDMSGMNAAERTRLMVSLRQAGFTRFIGYTNEPNMLHVDTSTANGPQWYMWDKSNKNIGNAAKWFIDGMNAEVQVAALNDGTMTDASPPGTPPADPANPGFTMPERPGQVRTDANPMFDMPWEARIARSKFADRDGIATSTAYWTKDAVRDGAVDGAIAKAQEMVINGGDATTAEQLLLNTVPDSILTDKHRFKINEARLAIRKIAEENAARVARQQADEEAGRLRDFSATFAQDVITAQDPAAPEEERKAAQSRLDPRKAAIGPDGQWNQERFERAKALLSTDNGLTEGSSKAAMYQQQNGIIEAGAIGSFEDYARESGDVTLLEKVNNRQPINEQDIIDSIWRRNDLRTAEKDELTKQVRTLVGSSTTIKAFDEQFEARLAPGIEARMNPSGIGGQMLSDPTLKDRAYRAGMVVLKQKIKTFIKEGKSVQFGEHIDLALDAALDAAGKVVTEKQDRDRELGNAVRGAKDTREVPLPPANAPTAPRITYRKTPDGRFLYFNEDGTPYTGK